MVKKKDKYGSSMLEEHQGITMTHNGIDIDQFILLTIYPTIVIFALGFIAKKMKMRESPKYILQALTCIVFSVAYFIVVPNGGAQGIAIVLTLFGILLFFMARKYTIHPIEEEEGEEGKTKLP